MLSMDDVFERMQYFANELQKFQDVLDASLAEIARRHDDVDPLWHDQRRRDYDARYVPLHEMLVKYVRHQSPEYVQFLHDRLRALDDYLHG